MKRLALGLERKSETTEINMAPLIDMVFILLIFFLVTTSFVKESGIEVERPKGTSSKEQKTNMTIAVTSDNEVWIERKPIDLRSVRARMTRYKHENPEGKVVITADENSRFGVAIEVLDQVRLAGILDAVVATTEEE